MQKKKDINYFISIFNYVSQIQKKYKFETVMIR